MWYEEERWRQEGRNEKRKGTMVWHIALSSPWRGVARTWPTSGLVLARSPLVYLSPAYARCPRFFIGLITAPSSMRPWYPQTRNMNVFTKMTRRVVHKPSNATRRCYNHRSASKLLWKHCGSFHSVWVFVLVPRVEWCTRCPAQQCPRRLIPL